MHYSEVTYLDSNELTEEFYCIRSLHISEALEMQIEVQRRLNEQLEVVV